MADIIDLDPIIVGFNGDPAHTPVYSVPSATMRVAEDLINATWNEAQGNKATFTAKMTAALSTWLDSATSPHVTAGTISAPGITEPNVTIPTAIDTSNIMSTYDTKYQELVAMLVAKFNDFRFGCYDTEIGNLGLTEFDLTTNPSRRVAKLWSVILAGVAEDAGKGKESRGSENQPLSVSSVRIYFHEEY